jgi:hypothetical protein
MTVTHIVSFRFKDDVPAEERNKVHAEFLALKGGCKREDGETAYIVELIGGKKNTSPEGAGKDFDVRLAARKRSVCTIAQLTYAPCQIRFLAIIHRHLC